MISTENTFKITNVSTTSFNKQVGQYSLLTATLGLLLVLATTLFPYDFCFNNRDFCSETVSEFHSEFAALGSVRNLLINLLLLLPFGFGVASLMHKKNLGETMTIAVVVAAGLVYRR